MAEAPAPAIPDPPDSADPQKNPQTNAHGAHPADPPPGFKPLRAMGDFIHINGPLWLRREGGVVQLGFRVEPRHCNPMHTCHGGMLASFADMLLPMTAHRKSPEVGSRFLPTVSLQLDYLAPAKLGDWVMGEADVLRVTRSLVFMQGLITANGVPAVRTSGVFKLGAPFNPANLLRA